MFFRSCIIIQNVCFYDILVDSVCDRAFTDVNTIAAFPNRSMMGIPQENCELFFQKSSFSYHSVQGSSIR